MIELSPPKKYWINLAGRQEADCRTTIEKLKYFTSNVEQKELGVSFVASPEIAFGVFKLLEEHYKISYPVEALVVLEEIDTSHVRE